MCIAVSKIELSMRTLLKIRLNILFTLLPVLLAQVVFSQNSAPGRKYHYIFTSWDTDDGLPVNQINTIFQTKDKYLWLGTDEGLVRFDGIDFRVYDTDNSALPSATILSLGEDTEGRLWVGTNNGLVIMQAGRFSAHPLAELSEKNVTSLYCDDLGTMWVGTFSSVMQITGVGIVKHPLHSEEFVRAITQAGSGSILAATNKGLHVVRGDSLIPREFLRTMQKYSIFSLHQSRDSSIWVGTELSGLFQLNQQKVKSFNRSTGLLSNRVNSITEDSDGSLWIGTMNGLVKIGAEDSQVFTTADGLTNNFILSLLTDDEDNLWICTAGGGLVRMKRSMVQTFSAKDGLSGEAMSAIVTGSDGTLWAGTYGSGLNALVQGKVRGNFSKTVPGTVLGIVEDDKQTVWVRTLEDGLFEINGGVATRVQFEEFRRNPVSAIGQDTYGKILISVRDGPLYQRKGNSLTRYKTPDGKFPQNIRMIYRGKHRLWLRDAENMLYGISRSETLTLGKEQGISAEQILTLYEDKDGSLWIGTWNGGLQRWKDGVVKTISSKEGLADNSIFQMFEDHAENLWMGSNKGIFRVAKADVEDVFEGRQQQVEGFLYGTADGMRTKECSGGAQPAGWKSSDGRIWFPTAKGIAVIDPTNTSTKTEPPVVNVDRIVAKREEYYIRNGLISLVSELRDIEIHYAGISYYAPERLTYRYMLEGYDQDWVLAGPRRVAYYTNLPSGGYRFRVMASIGNNQWSEALPITVELAQRFNETLWFYVAVIFSITLVGAGGHWVYRRYRDRGVIASRLREQLAVTQLDVLRSQLRPHFLFNTLNTIMVNIQDEPKLSYNMLAKLSNLLRLSLEDLETHEVPLKKEIEFTKLYLELQKARFGKKLKLKYMVDKGLRDFLVPSFILQPVVENAITHGFVDRMGGWLIEVGASTNGSMLTLHVRDNGAGFSDISIKQFNTGLGLSNTKARLNHLYQENHTLQIGNLPGGGAEVIIKIPKKERNSR
ncbi:MAG TPA: two-component regulator propeller domain-containing protein [Bacteroidota bacterium]